MKTRSTTIVAVRRNGTTALASDGQVTIGDTIFKHGAQKIRTLRDGKVVVGYAGSAADAMALFERLEAKLDEYSGNVQRAVVELAKQWRLDRALRRLEAFMLVADRDNLMLISGTGDIIVPDEDVFAIGSGGPMAEAAALALLKHTELGAREIAEEALHIAARLCIYTNDNLTVEVVT
jgi:ATP-dependent HslUV protease subunit HslV